jgi:peptide/nickel transport system substrate-binding protein
MFDNLLRRFALLAAVALCPAATAVAATETPATGGILRVAQRAEPKTWNPVTAIDAPSREVLRRIHADLITINRQTQRTAPALAESWKVSKDGRIYDLQLRAGVKFSDGHPFTADDVAFTFAVHLDEKVASPQRDLLLMDGKPIAVRVRDPRHVTFELPQPYAAAERLFDSIAILPKHKLEVAFKSGALRQSWTLATPPSEIAGLGPFRIREYKPGEAVRLERNPYYWRAAAEKQPYLDGIEFRFLPDEDTQLANFVAGRLDLLNRLQPKAIQYLESRNVAVTDLGPSLEYNFVCFNLSPGSKLAKQQPELRRALSAAVDRRAMAKLVYQDRATPIWGPVTPGNKLWYFEVEPAKPNHDIAAARTILAKAGFRWNTQGQLLDRDTGAPVTFSILVSASSAERIQMANLVAADWKELGVAAQIVTLEFRSLLDRVMNTRQFDAVLLGLGGGDADPNADLNVWLSSGAMHLWNPNQKQPATPWEAEIDNLMRRQLTTVAPAARRKLYQQALSILARELPMIFLVSPNIVTAQNGGIGNFKPAALDHYTLWNAGELYLLRK